MSGSRTLVITAVILLGATVAHAGGAWAKTSNALEYGGYAAVGSKNEGGTGVQIGGQLGFCILCVYGSDKWTIGDSHSIYYGYPLGGAIAEGLLVRYGASDDIDVGARILYELYDDGRGGGKQGAVGVVEARWQRITGSATFAVGGESYGEGSLRVMLDEIYGLKAYVVRTENTWTLRLAFAGFIF